MDHSTTPSRFFNATAHWLLPALLSLLCLCAVSAAHAQDAAGEAETQEQASGWQSPDLADLPPDWWAQLDAVAEDIRATRIQRFMEKAQGRVSGLDPDNLARAQGRMQNLRSLADLLEVTEQTQAEAQFAPIPTQDSYSLRDLLVLQDQLRGLQKEQVQTTLENEQTQRKIQLLEERRDTLVRRYSSLAKESPERILLGIDRVSTRFEYETELLRADRLRAALQAIRQQINLLEEQIAFAFLRLDEKDSTLEEQRASLAEARSRLSNATQRQAGLQERLLDAISGDATNTQLRMLRTQQLTRALTETALAELEVELVQARLDWYLLRNGQLDSDFDYGIKEVEARQFTEELLKQIEVWRTSSQNTLVAPLPEGNANARANAELAQSVARDTLVVLEQIRNLSDDLLLVRDVVSSEVIASQSGLAKAWAQLSLATGEFWSRVSRLLDYTLFNMGDVPVTPGGLVTMILILVLAWVISRFVRHLFERLGRRKQFAHSPAMYTLSRLTHYIIITIGVFAALASIGIDFSNFALIAGALSVGIGFGLQAIVNNFVSGLILLFEGSLRVGDHIELDSGLSGVVREINTRATVVNTTDGIDVVVPNSELVTTKLTNWTLRESIARVRIGFGVAYGSDKEKVREVALAAAQEMEFIILNMPGREPQVRLVNFGDSSLDFELLAWVSRQGVRRPHRVRASFLWALETGLNEAGIEIPFPQRDLHIKSRPGKNEQKPS